MVYQIGEKTHKKIVTECVEEVKCNDDFEKAFQKTVERNKGRLFEMAFPRKVYMSKIDGIAPQIIENICLVRHCVICNQTRYKTHWEKELKGFMETIMRCDIKGAKGWEAKEKAIREIWDID